MSTRATTFPFKLNVSAKTCTLCSHVPDNVLYAKLQIAQYLQQDYTTICKKKTLHVFIVGFHRLGFARLIRTSFGFANGIHPKCGLTCTCCADIIARVSRVEKIPFRPYLKCEIGGDMSHNQLLQLVTICWHQEPEMRPDFTRICAEFTAINQGK